MERLRIVGLVLLLVVAGCCADGTDGTKKKNAMDYTDADLERLAQQWEDDEERDDADNFPPRRPKPPPPAPAFDPSKMRPGKEGMEDMLKQSKKGQVLMVFVKIGNDPSKSETEELTSRWEEGLRNGGLLAQRYIISDGKAIFMLQDGSEAWAMKDFLVEQQGCVEVEIDQKKYPGKRPDRPGFNTAKNDEL